MAPESDTTGFERLSALDRAFLSIEDERDPMHIALLGIFDKGPLTLDDGQLDRERLRLYSCDVIASLPKFRQRVVTVRWLGAVFLCDDPEFDLDYHVRFVELDPPGNETQLKALVSRIFTEPLARDRPLWQMWCIDGVEKNRFAVVTKVHHCLVDGVAGVAVIAAMLRTTPDTSSTSHPVQRAAVHPSPRELLRSELGHRLAQSKALLHGVPDVPRSLEETANNQPDLARGVRALAQWFRRAPSTRLNPRHVGAIRRFDWLRLDFERVRAVKRAAGVTVNDVVLATVAGGLRLYLERHGVDPSPLRLRAMVPVSLHKPGETHIRNEVSLMLTALPVDEADPKRRLERIAEATHRAKMSGQSRVLGVLEVLAELTVPGVTGLLVRLAMAIRPFNVIVTNVPGPGFPLYLLGAPLLDALPLVPLYVSQSVGIAVLSYAGGLYYGFNVDAASMKDVSVFARCVRESFEAVEAAYH
jgi:WS/DGAT/MGAT family acyltransferase